MPIFSILSRHNPVKPGCPWHSVGAALGSAGLIDAACHGFADQVGE
jgi:hypothetical protein